MKLNFINYYFNFGSLEMSKRKCITYKDYSEEWRFIRKGRHVEEVQCTMCMSFISIRHAVEQILYCFVKINENEINAVFFKCPGLRFSKYGHPINSNIKIISSYCRIQSDLN